MHQIYDSLDAHVASAGDLAHACVPLGMLLAWCANLRLLSDPVEQAHAQLLLRIRVQEVTGAELLVACGGDFQRALLNRRGQTFMDGYFAGYMQEYGQVFEQDVYAVADNWNNYQLLATVLTRRLMVSEGRVPAAGNAVQVTWLQRLRDLWRAS